MSKYQWDVWGPTTWRLFDVNLDNGRDNPSLGQLRRDGAGEYWLTPRVMGIPTNYETWPAIKLEGITTLEDAQAAGLVLLSLKQTEIGND